MLIILTAVVVSLIVVAIKYERNYAFIKGYTCGANISCEQVEKYDTIEGYREQLEQMLPKYGIDSKYTTLLLMQLFQESGADEKVLASDPWQSSQSLCGKNDCIKDPLKSTKQALSYHQKNIELAKKMKIDDPAAIIQAYNFGSGFLRWMSEQGYQEYSEQIAYQFSVYQTQKLNLSTQVCPFDTAKREACYGDYKYIYHIQNRYQKYQDYKEYKQEYERALEANNQKIKLLRVK